MLFSIKDKRLQYCMSRFQIHLVVKPSTKTMFVKRGGEKLRIQELHNVKTFMKSVKKIHEVG
jgi:hypothetical protein